jgi:hypothetical protein
MKSTYRLFPDSGYILETYRGVVRLADIVASDERRRRDRRCRPHFHLVSDYRRANVLVSPDEIAALAAAPTDESAPRQRYIALILANGRNLAFATLYKSMLATRSVYAECFVGVESACAWLAALSGSSPSSERHVRVIPQTLARTSVEGTQASIPARYGFPVTARGSCDEVQ